ncbi:MAG: outer membrane protein transport protein [Betaproteobacteria bacterium]|nr:outer membrane protein transport protein [Betaproteobacteria bacterium]MCC7217105.1 outer membrane protein transport protein [Burkholderiales bacterium]
MIGVACVPAFAGGIILYEVGTADVGLAAAGYGARAQDASTVLTNPAGMSRLDGTQVLAAGQLLWGDVRYSIGGGTSPALGGNNGGYPVGQDGWFLGGGGFTTYRVTPDLTLGFAATGNFGMPLNYDENWVGRYYVQEATLLGLSFLPSIAYKVNDKLSVGVALNAMYGLYKNQVAINNVLPSYGDGQLKMDDEVWGFGANVGVLYQPDARTRWGLVWNSQVNLDFNAALEWSNLAPGLRTLLDSRGLLSASLGVGIKVPQGVMLSVYSETTDRWALLGSVGWQQWSKFGQVQFGLDNVNDPTGVVKNLEYKDTWHVSAGAQYRLSEPWLVNFGIAYDSKFQTGSISPLLPANNAWRFGAGAQQQLERNRFWGFAAEYAYGGGLDVNLKSDLPVAAGGRGDLVGAYNQAGSVFLAAYYNWKF